MTYGNAPRTQGEWDRKRKAVKEAAAPVVEKNAKDAQKAKKAFQTRNKPKSIDVITETTEVQTKPDKTVDLHVEPANTTQTFPAQRGTDEPPVVEEPEAKPEGTLGSGPSQDPPQGLEEK